MTTTTTQDAGLAGFIKAEQPRLIRTLATYTGDRDLAEELAAETLARLVRDWGRVGEMAAPGAYAHRTAVNLANSWFRRRAAHRRAVARRGPPQEVHHDPDSTEFVAVREAVAKLPPQQRAAVALHHMAGFSTAEVAEQLGVAPSTVRSNLHHARVALRTALGGDIEFEAAPLRPQLPTEVVLERATTLKRRRTAAAILALVLALGTAVGVVAQGLSRPATPVIAPEPGETPVWQSLPPAPVVTRSEPLVADLPDGRIIVVGGVVYRDDGSALFATDGAILSADKSDWLAVPPVPIDLAAERGVVFAVSGTTLWARQLGATGIDGAPAAEGLRLAQLDLSDPEADWVTLPPVALGPSVPTVAIVGEWAVALTGELLGGQDESGLRQAGLAPFDTSGAVWRDGTWSAFDAAPTQTVASPFIGTDGNHLAVVGGHTGNGTTADAVVLDLTTGDWTTAPAHPAGPRAHLRAGVNSLAVDGRVLVAGGVAEQVSGEVRQYAQDAAWLDMTALTWEPLDLPYDTVPIEQGTTDLLPPDELQLPVQGETPDGTDLVRIDEQGRLVPANAGPTDFVARTIQYLQEQPALAISHNLGPDTNVRASLATRDGQWIEVTLNEELTGVTYMLHDDRLLAAGGIPYDLAAGDSEQQPTDTPLIVWQLSN